MQNKQQMLASDRARATYAKLQRQGVAITVCRGTTGDHFNFFYSGFSYWSNNCLGWVIDDPKKSKICTYCLVTAPPEREFELKNDDNEIRKEPRNSNRLSGQSIKPSKPRPSKLRPLHKSGEHSSNSNKDVSSVKSKKAKEATVQKTKKRARK
jgi:hypothetical protein